MQLWYEIEYSSILKLCWVKAELKKKKNYSESNKADIQYKMMKSQKSLLVKFDSG